MAASILGGALMVLAACWALNLAVRLLVASLPVLLGVLGVVLLAVIGLRLLRQR